jgi:DNA-directed RNA polymerase delta subunit
MIAAENFMIHHLENVQYCEIFHHKLDAMMTDEITPFNHQQFINEVIDYHLSEHANLNDEIMKLYKI